GIAVRHLELYILIGQDGLPRPAGLFRDLVQQVGVDIGAYAEAEDACGGAFGLFCDHAYEGVTVTLADGGQAIGEKEHHEGASRLISFGHELESGSKGVLDCGTTSGAEALHIADDGLSVCLGCWAKLLEEGLSLRAEANDLESVGIVEVLNTELQGALGLLKFFAGHGAGGVDDE